MKLWGGRFSGETDKLAGDFHSSLPIDKRLFREDICGSIAHAKMLAACRIINNEDAESIVKGLNELSIEIETGLVDLDPAAEDIHMNLESLLTAKIGEAGKKLHTARSRNDQVALDFRLCLKGELAAIESLIKQLLQVLLDLAKKHINTLMPGYTHLQKAQPITFAHHLLAYVHMFRRDIGRLQDCNKRMNESPLGSGALAGTGFPIDRDMTAFELGFERPTANSLDGVSDRDFSLEFLSAAAIIMMHTSRFCEEIILWSSYEFGFITLDDAYSTGSSIMPQKKNPDMAELIRGKTGRVYGSLMAHLTIMKGLPLAYNKDMQEDKEITFDAIDTVKSCLTILSPMLDTMHVNEQRMLDDLQQGFINATDLADYLVDKGISFREAHEVSGKLVAIAEAQNITLDQLSLADMQNLCSLFADDVFDAIALEACLAKRSSYGGPAPAAAENAIIEIEKWLMKQP